MKIKLLLVALLPMAVAAQNLTQYVDPRIGTGDHGHVFVGANVPFGLVLHRLKKVGTGAQATTRAAPRS